MTLLGAILAASLPLTPAGTAYRDAKDVQLKAPEGVACSDSGAVVVSDTGNGRFVLYKFDGRTLTGGRELRVPQITRPGRARLDSKGNLYVLDRKGRRIGKLAEDGAFGGFVQPKSVPNGGALFVKSFDLDAKDNLYLLDPAGGRVVVLDPSGAFVRQLELPRGSTVSDLAVDPLGPVWIVDAVRKQLYSAEKGAFAAVGKPLGDVLSFPGALTVTAHEVVIADQHGMGLVVMGRDGVFLGRRLSIGWTEGNLYYPAQVCIDAKGDAFIADSGNNRVQAFAPPR